MGTVRDGSHLASTVLVGWMRSGWRCRCPFTVADFHSSRASSPLYQPIRKALTRNDRAVVETYRVTGSPGSTLACPA